MSSNVLKPNSSHLEIILPVQGPVMSTENLPLKSLHIEYHVAQIHRASPKSRFVGKILLERQKLLFTKLA